MMIYTHRIGFEQTLFTILVNMAENYFEKIKNIPFKVVYLHMPDANGYALPITSGKLKIYCELSYRAGAIIKK